MSNKIQMEKKARYINQVGASVERYMRSGYCCSEAMLLAVADGFGVEKEALPLVQAEAMCGGMKDRSGPCGVLTGGILALGQLGQRVDRGLPVETQFRLRFEQLAGSLVCKKILAQRPLFSWKSRACRQLTRQGGELLSDLLLDAGVAPDNGTPSP